MLFASAIALLVLLATLQCCRAVQRPPPAALPSSIVELCGGTPEPPANATAAASELVGAVEFVNTSNAEWAYYR